MIFQLQLVMRLTVLLLEKKKDSFILENSSNEFLNETFNKKKDNFLIRIVIQEKIMC